MNVALLHRERSFRGRSDARSPVALNRLQRLLGLADDAHDDLVRLCEDAVVHVGARSIIADEGEPQSQAYLILEGWACRCRFVDSNRRQITSLLLPGDFSNPELDLDPRLGIDHMVCSLTPLIYAAVDTDELAAVVARSPGLALALQLQRRREQSIQREWAVSLGRRSACERVAHLICELHRRLDCDPSKRSLTIDMPLLQADLADAVGLTPIHVNRMLQQLRALGLIKSSHNHITISDLAGLQRLACFDETYLRLAGVA
ncbi:Crp/Fnr family transcriptional regulator [Sphingosinicellaceae bacterium]|nr:Crp/Fnr family transcriptional regulator [Sphingosinicellaceae bacterium]